MAKDNGAVKRIILKCGGVKAVGQYEAGTVYSVDAKEADRLINVKGFKLATAADDKPVAAVTTKTDKGVK